MPSSFVPPPAPPLLQAILDAEQQIRPHVRTTPAERSAYYTSAETEVWLKHEQLQHTGSFKVRGAFNMLLSRSPAQQNLGVVAASTGNHGAAVAFACAKLGIPAKVFVPEGASGTKVDAIRRLGAGVEVAGVDPVETEAFARRYAQEAGLSYCSPYNDLAVVAGQGTIGLELLEQMPPPDAVFVALGGGGLIAGIAGYLKAVLPGVTIIGCSPAASAAMVASIDAGHLIEIPHRPTLSDGTAGGIEPGALTFALCRELVDAYVTVTEPEIAEAMRRFMGAHHMLIEGAAAVALAAFLKTRAAYAHKRVAIILCGANISLDDLRRVLANQ